MNRTLTLVAVKATLGASLALGLLMTPHAVAHADTVNLADVPSIDSMPTCQLEDGSDSATLPCVWTNKHGDAYLTYEDHSVRIVDDTVDGYEADAGDYVGGYN
jgi:hypothetical protein